MATLVVAIALYVIFSEFWQEPRFRTNADRDYRASVARIERELSTGVANEWSGTYYASYNDQYVALTLGDSKDFVFQFLDLRHGGTSNNDRNFGEFRIVDGLVELIPRFDPKKMPVRLLRKQVGNCHYLLQEEHVQLFEKAVQSGTEPRSTRRGTFLLRGVDIPK